MNWLVASVMNWSSGECYELASDECYELVEWRVLSRSAIQELLAHERIKKQQKESDLYYHFSDED